MASSGKDTEGSQFFVTHSPQPHLDGRYTAFGRVVEGQDVVDRIVEGDLVRAARVIARARRAGPLAGRLRLGARVGQLGRGGPTTGPDKPAWARTIGPGRPGRAPGGR